MPYGPCEKKSVQQISINILIDYQYVQQSTIWNVIHIKLKPAASYMKNNKHSLHKLKTRNY